MSKDRRTSDQITADWQKCQDAGGCQPSTRYTKPRLVKIQQRSRYVVEDHRRLPICKVCGVPIIEGALR
jgi:hypothetical protein